MAVHPKIILDPLKDIEKELSSFVNMHVPGSSLILDVRQGDLNECGPTAFNLLTKAIEAIHKHVKIKWNRPQPIATWGIDQRQFQDADRLLRQALRLCDEKFLTYPYAKLPCRWRRLYTDASIIKACAALTFLPRIAELDKCWYDIIKQLDLAIIIAGCPGKDRKEIVQSLIRACQSQLINPPDVSYPPRAEPARKRKRAMDDGEDSNVVEESQDADWHEDIEFKPTSLADNKVEEVVLPSYENFLNQDRGLYRKPFVVRGAALGWRAKQREEQDSRSSAPYRWACPYYLERLAGPGRVVPVEIGANYTQAGWGQDIILWSDFLRLSGWSKAGDKAAETSSPPLYLAQHDLLSQFPELLKDIKIPKFVTSYPPKPEGVGYKPVDNDNQYLINAWLGPEGTLSPPHYDRYFNCFVQVIGHKEFWIAPPRANANGKMAAYGDPEPGESIGTSLMTNTSKIDVFARNPPATFEERARPLAQHVVLAPGDMLYMPPGWWHSVKSLSKSFSVSIWF